jgi:nucleotide-binding universal stress UspA family protein
MEMLESITVPLDGTARAARALQLAAEVVRRTGGTLDLVVVTSPGLDLFEDERLLDEAASSVDVPIGSKQVVERDSVVEAICDLQRAQPRSLVCMSTHARTGVPELLLGGVAGEVLREMTRPVLLVGPHAETPPSLDTVLVCLDGSDAAEEALPAAEAWALAVGATLWLVCVAPPTATTAPAEANDLRRVVRDIEARSDLHVEWEVLHGRDVPKAIVDFAGLLPASVIAMATHGRSGAGGRLLGSVTMRVAHDARCPVLVTRSAPGKAS